MSELNPSIEQKPAVLNFNYEAFKAQLEQRLEQYRTVVTIDTVKEAKETATELNKLKTDLDTKRKEAIRFVSAPIKLADDQMKECVKLVADGRQEILDQVAKFDQVRLDLCKEKLIEFRDSEREFFKVSPEFFQQANDITHLVKQTNLTAKDNLTASATRGVRELVTQEQATQQTVERRLLELENASYKAGLAAPLTRSHVEHFLKADEDTYKAKLQQLVDVEIDRQQQAEARIRQTVERESQSREALHGQQIERQARLAAEEALDREYSPADIEEGAALFDEPGHGGYAIPEPQAQAAPTAPQPGQSETFTLTVTMTATLPAGMTVDDVDGQFRAFIEGPGNTRVDFMTVEKEAEATAA